LLLKFFGLTFAATWLLWAAARVVSTGGDSEGGAAAGAAVIFFIGVAAPGLVAVALTYRDEGAASAAALLGRALNGRVDFRWYVFALGLMPATKLLVALLHRLLTGEWPVFGETRWYVMAAAILISTWVQAGEEVGWRGYALPRLAGRFGLAPASLLIGAIWAAWHLPLFFVPGGDTFGQSFPVYLLQVTALSTAMAWLYWRTQGSLLLVMVLHASVNNTKDIVPSAVQGATDPFLLSASVSGWLTLAVLWAVAAVLLFQMRGVGGLASGASARGYNARP
jgi:membrane protease YdiL (CAAX protease family)